LHEDEDEMDEFIRQAYADGMLNDHSQIAPDPMDDNPSPSSFNTNQPSTTTNTTINRISTYIDEPEELIYISDDEDKHLSEMNIPPSSTLSYNQTSHISSPDFSIPVQPPVIKVSLPYTYLSLIRHSTFPSNKTHQDFSIKGCFASLVGNPRIIKNDFELQAYLNDGSDCLLVRLASDILVQRIGVTPNELMTKRKECKNDLEKQKLQKDFNERLKEFGPDMDRVNAIITIRIFSDNQTPIVIKIDGS
jgi:hypothetical protein